MLKKLRRPENKSMLFILPALIFFTVFIVLPVFNSVNLSFTNWDGITPDLEYIGFENFKMIFADARFYNALKNTLVIGFSFTILVNIVALFAAVLVDKVIVGKNIFRSAFYLPVLISGVIAGFIWSIMFNYSFGIINNIFKVVGLNGIEIDFLGKMPNALYAIIFVLIWQRTGYYMVIYLAGLQGIPGELVESARIDGASPWQRFRYIVFPLIAGSVTVNMTLALINGLKIFDQIAVMTDGGPGFSTESVTYLIYKVAFGELKQGYGTALALILFIIVLVVSIGQVLILKKREVQL
jgi:multiple sugar transport system permease protein/raffinose/stachyose/melibiose transport system permease protein